jgi:ABC-type cobalamin/Fe3+-siderophores transport system ATPase subunit
VAVRLCIPQRKSTLLRGLARLLNPTGGGVYLDGKSIHQMPTRDVVTADVVAEVFGMRSQIVRDPVSGTPMVVPLGRHHTAA